MSDLLGSLAENLEEEDNDAVLDVLTRAREQRVRLPLPNHHLPSDD